jgi:hypothetical protein
MTQSQKLDMIDKLIDAYKAGYISLTEYSQRSKAIHKAYFDSKYGKLDLSDIPA